MTVTALDGTATLTPTLRRRSTAGAGWAPSGTTSSCSPRRNLVHIAREPLQLSDVTVQPVLFTLLFIYVFGSGVPIHGGSYKDFAIAGLMLLNLTTSAMGTAVGLSLRPDHGAIDRFRTLPMWRSAVLVGRSIADLLSAALCVVIVALTGLAIGWRPGPGVGIGARRLRRRPPLRLCPLLGLRVPRHRLQGAGVGPGHRPDHPVPAGHRLQRPGADHRHAGLAAGHRRLEPGQRGHRGGSDTVRQPEPVGPLSAWPMQHPIEAALVWSVAILVVFAPLAAYLYRRRTTG